MSYELDNLKREVDSLKWQKCDGWKLEQLEGVIFNDIKNRISKLENEQSYFRERIQDLEDRLNNP